MIVKIERKERKKRAKEKLEKMGRRVSQATDAIKKMRKKADKYKDNEPDTDNEDVDLEANPVESNGRIDTNKYFWWFIVLAIFCGFFIGWLAHTGLITSLEADPITTTPTTTATTEPG